MSAEVPVLVSVVIPCHNSAKTIELCVQSALAQTYPRVEVIVVDDASTDATPELVAALDCVLIRLTDNVGAGIARNHGIAASRGEVLFFLDSDVALAPDAVANAMEILRRNPDYGAVWGVYGDRPLIDDGVVERVQVLYGHYRATRKLGPARTGHLASGAVPRRVIDELGAFDERLLGQYSNEDHEFSLRIADRYPVVRTLAVVGYHDDDDQISSVLGKCFRRAASLVPLVFQQRGLKPEREATHRPQEVLAAAASVASAPLALFSPVLGLLPLTALVWFVASDLGLLRFVWRRAGWRLLLPTVALSYLYGLAIAAGAVHGGLRYLLDRRFRRRYRRPAVAH
jgi:hypothetical protein